MLNPVFIFNIIYTAGDFVLIVLPVIPFSKIFINVNFMMRISRTKMKLKIDFKLFNKQILFMNYYLIRLALPRNLLLTYIF